MFRDDSGSSSDTDRGFTDPDFKDSGDRRPPHIPGPTGAPPQSAPLGTGTEPERTSSPPHKEHVDSCNTIQGPTPAPKPKLWSLAEIATSSDRCKGSGEAPQACPGLGQSAVLGAGGSPSRSSPQCPLPSSTVLSRPLYYTSPFYPGYTNYGGTFGHLHSNHGSVTTGSTAHFNGLNQTVLNRAEALVRESQKVRGQTQVDLCKDSPYELKKGMSNI